MKNTKFNYFRKTILLVLVLITSINCEREMSDDATIATYPKTAEIFTDAPVGMGTNFYFPYGPDANNPVGSKFSAWSVDSEVSYKGNASMRFDVPNANDPEGNYAGGILRIDGAGRDLTGYDALTFWAKASEGVTVGEIGFGEDFYPNKYITTMRNISLGTTWVKYIIPIPDASKLVQERGVFRYSAGTQGTNGAGYTFWIDELKFEKLGTIGQPRPSIATPVTDIIDTFIGVTIPNKDLRVIFNMPSGQDQIVYPAPAYFIFKSSNPNTATVDQNGKITVVGTGTAVITANIGSVLDTTTNEYIGGINSIDSITINSLGTFSLPPTPTRDQSNVLSIFSDSYTNVPVAYYNGFWFPGQSTTSADFSVNDNNFLYYKTFNYVGIATSGLNPATGAFIPPLNATNMTNIHFNMYIPNNVPPNFSFLISIEDWGPNQIDNGGDDTRQQIFVTASQVQANSWVTIEAPLTLVNRNNIGLIIMENINGSSLSDFYMDNIYFYKP
ncbi:glycosyl hydrolase family 16 [Flavobacterium sp.]|uniref:glycosyl hydrolase family 16 n=1 Tax=Flavobacterium sp. TaxID=239 RepID=UPI0037BFA51F